MQALDEGDLRPDQVEKIAKRFGVTEGDVVSMNRRMGGDTSLNTPVRSDVEGAEWQDWLEDNQPSQEETLGESQELTQRRNYLEQAMASSTTANGGFSRHDGLRKTRRHLKTSHRSSVSPASASAKSRCGPLKRSTMPFSGRPNRTIRSRLH